MEYHRHRSWIEAGILCGFWAGVVLALVEILGASFKGEGALTPVRWAASAFIGAGALVEQIPTAALFVFGGSAHAALTALHGLVFAALMRKTGWSLRLRPSAIVAAGILFGAWSWFFNFQLLGHNALPWLREADQGLQLLAHAFGFGLPLGLAFAWMERQEENLLLERYRAA